MVYKNINRRILILAKEGFIEEVPYTKRTPHGRIDYQLTMMGFASLIPHYLNHPNEIKGLVNYIDKFGLDKIRIAGILIGEHSKTIEALNEYQKQSGGMLYDPFKNLNYEGLESTIELREIIQLQEIYDYKLKKTQSEMQISLKHIQESRVRIRDATGELKSKNLRIGRSIAEREIVNKRENQKKKKQTDADDKEFLHEMKLSMMPYNTAKKVTKRSNVKELEIARNIAEIEVTITEYYENIRLLLWHHGIEVIIERDRNKNNIILKRSVSQKDDDATRSPDELKLIRKSADQSIERMKEAFPITTETIKKLEEIGYKIEQFSKDKSIEIMEGITTTTKIDKKRPT